jgi:glycosyltransferase involved in cell wall biosynthesis
MNPPQNPVVLMLSYPFPPAVSAGVQRTLRHIKYLPKFHWQPVIVTVQPRVEKIRTDSSLKIAAIQSLDVVRVKHFELLGSWRARLKNQRTSEQRNSDRAGVSGVGLGDNEKKLQSPIAGSVRRSFSQFIKGMFNIPDAKVWWAIPALPASIAAVWQHRPSIIYSTAPPHSSHLLAIGLGILTRRHVVLDFRDPWARSPWQAGTNSRVARMIDSCLESLCIRLASAVVLNTNRVRAEFTAHYGDRIARKFFVVPNGYDPEHLSAIKGSGLEENSAKEVLRILHPGTLYGKRSILTLARAISQLEAEGVSVMFSQIGITKLDQETEDAIRELGVAKNLRIVAPLPHHDLLQEMGRYDCFIVVQPDTPLQVPSKLYEMMMFSKPIIALTGNGETADLVTKYHLGFVADPSDVAQIANCLRVLARSESTFCDAARKHALCDFDGEKLTGQLAQIFSSLVETV